MNSEPTINPRRLILILVFLLVVSGAVLFWLRDIVREVVVLPISYLLFVLGIVIDTAPQIFFWLAAIIIAFWIAFRSISTRHRAVSSSIIAPILSDTGDRNPYGGRVAFWANRVNHMHRYRSQYYLSTFHQSLARLLIELLAHRYRLTILQAEERLRIGLLDVPSDIREYVLSSLSRRDFTRQNPLTRLWKSILETVRGRFFRHTKFSGQLEENKPETQLESQIARIIHYMEEELQVTHDHPSQ